MFNLIVSYLTAASSSKVSNDGGTIEYHSGFLLILGVIILAPILEEIVFRGLMRQLIANKYNYIVISSLLFSLIHSPENSYLFLGVFISGILFSLSYIKTNNLVIPICIHLINNLVAIFLN
ncbi:CPBP family intramembrane glutamic endopeptidase [Vagococcus hydrophili]|uniref:CPBP family intramembrane metalloprotease n=1 Tax=Vagococcus hydrophili TaxID=2714947 RepID=A0A6G8ASN4_9ENTE|nr:CPBP family intramembrane metalloprotease [Vagococcus hydrophili]